MRYILPFPLSTPTTTTHAASKQGIENISGMAGTHPAVLHTLLTELIILRPLVLVGQHFVSPRDFLELLLITTLVGVVLDRKLAISLLNVGRRCRLVDTQSFVQLLVVYRTRRSSGTFIETGESSEEH